MSSRPLEGVRVLDLTRLLPGGFATQVLCDLGADIVKIEEPQLGDYSRWIPPEVDGAGYAFSSVNKGKRSVAIDLKQEGSAALVLQLAKGADVMIESLRPGVLDRLGLSDEDFARANPRLIRASLVGFGPGPLRDAPGHDLAYQALAGILALSGTPERPVEPGAQLADVGGALYVVIAILAALHERDRTGDGARVEVALEEAALGANAMHLARARAGPAPVRGAWELSGGLPGYRIARCADGRFLAFAPLEEKFWARFCHAVGRPELEERILDTTAAREVEAILATRPRDAWVDDLLAAGVPVAPVLEPADALAHPQHARFAGRPGPGAPLTGGPSEGAVPALGEHTDEVLREAGLSDAEIAAARSKRLIR